MNYRDTIEVLSNAKDGGNNNTRSHALVLRVNKQLIGKDDEGSGKPTLYFPMRELGRIK